MKHLSDSDLALLAGGELTLFPRLRAKRHISNCTSCQEQMDGFARIREDLSGVGFHESGCHESLESELSSLPWESLASEMRANIRLGLEAGACVRSAPAVSRYNPRLIVALASLCLLIGSSFLFDRKPAHVPTVAETNISVLAATAGGLELRTGQNSLTLLNHHGAVADQTVGAEGEIRARYVDSETGSVTINNVYLSE